MMKAVKTAPWERSDNRCNSGKNDKRKWKTSLGGVEPFPSHPSTRSYGYWNDGEP